MSVRVGVVGTSWWTDAMYLPALRARDDVDVVAVAGRDPDRTSDFARRWEVGRAVTDIDELLGLPLDAIIVASANDSHHPITVAALDRGLDVLCEKPLGLTVAEAAHMTEAATRTGAVTLVPFTYRHMPMIVWVRRLIEQGYLGTPHRLGMRYFTDFARGGEYLWRFDAEVAGSGVIGDLGSHWLSIALWLMGDIAEIGCVSTRTVERADRPDGRPYERSEDGAVMTVRFANGAIGVLEVNATCWEGTGFGQTHHLDAHGHDGTLYATCDWDTVQEVRGVRADTPGPAAPLPIPDDVWGRVRRDSVHDTYRDVFRVEGAMIGEFIDAVLSREPCTTDFAHGLRVQRLVDAAVQSASSGGALLSV